MKLVIDRQKWSRGGNNGCGLLNDGGYMCCLGFYALACGITDEHISNRGTPAGIYDSLTSAPPPPESFRLLLVSAHGGYFNSGLANDLMMFNDDPEFDDATREIRITESFAKHGVEVEFIN